VPQQVLECPPVRGLRRDPVVDGTGLVAGHAHVRPQVAHQPHDGLVLHLDQGGEGQQPLLLGAPVEAPEQLGPEAAVLPVVDHGHRDLSLGRLLRAADVRAIEVRAGVVQNPKILFFQGRATDHPHPRL
jgi:hypothetical protein